MNFKVSITEMYPWNPWELFADPLESAEHTIGITALRHLLLKFLIFLSTVFGLVTKIRRR